MKNGGFADQLIGKGVKRVSAILRNAGYIDTFTDWAEDGSFMVEMSRNAAGITVDFMKVHFSPKGTCKSVETF